MKVVVLGAGVVGVTTAWFLRQEGHDVTVIDRQSGAAMETSHANGGQISVSHAEPWANPQAPLKALRWIGREDAPLLFRLRADPALWRWAFGFLRECAPARTNRNIRALVNLGLYSCATLREVRDRTGIRYDHLSRGILHFYTSNKSLDDASLALDAMREQGCRIDTLSRADAIRIEPALSSMGSRLAGATYAPDDESGDAFVFTQRLAAMAAKRGVGFRYRTRVCGIDREGHAITGVRVEGPDAEVIRADAYVMAMGSYSPLWAKSLGFRLAIYPAKGYSATFPVRDPALAYTVSMTDEEHKLVFSRLGDRLRIAGTAEFNGYSLDLNDARCRALLGRVQSLFPGMVDGDSASFWTGLRPATPGNLPCIGRSPLDNLWLNTGHGTLGWTQSCGSARALTDLMSGRVPDVDFPFLRA